MRRAASWTHPRQDRSGPRGARTTRGRDTGECSSGPAMAPSPLIAVVLAFEGRVELGARRLGLRRLVRQGVEVLLELLLRDLVAAQAVLQRAHIELHVLAALRGGAL